MFIIVIGCGKFGSNLAKDLSDDGNDICIIDRDLDKLNTLGSGFNGRRIRGVEYDKDNLIKAGIEQADALIAVASNDNINITVSLVASKVYYVPKIIARVNEPEKTLFYHKLGIDVINPIQYEIEVLKSKMPIKSLDVISSLDTNYEIVEFIVNKEKNISVIDTEVKFHCVISGIIKDGEAKIEVKEEKIRVGDMVVCTIHKKDKGKIVNYFCKEMFL